MRAAARCLALALAAARDVAVPGPAFTDCVARGAEPAEGQATVFWSEADHFVDGAERQHAAAALLLRHGAHDANGTVVDVGAGRGGLRRFLPPATAYVAADVTGYGIGAVLCDVNRLEFPFLLAPGEAATASVSVEALAGPREAEEPAAVHLRAGRQPCVYELDPEGEEVVRTDVTREACLWASGIDVVDSRLRAVHWRAANETTLFRGQHVRLPGGGEPDLNTAACPSGTSTPPLTPAGDLDAPPTP
ncbi:hypothetical protein JL721_9594 [Aureococcus anophagefferens]|nr:hypothetical protein JL721_9594 [Aureococcus anophagefferens]